MEKVLLKQGKICLATFLDGTKGRFDSRSKDVIYVSLSDNFGIFYKTASREGIERINEQLQKYEIVLEYI